MELRSVDCAVLLSNNGKQVYFFLEARALSLSLFAKTVCVS